jgi:hypothetical protein
MIAPRNFLEVDRSGKVDERVVKRDTKNGPGPGCISIAEGIRLLGLSKNRTVFILPDEERRSWLNPIA